MSNYSVRQLQATLSDSQWSRVASKVHRVYPHHPKPMRRTKFPDLMETDPLHVLFVGVTFFGKGGEAVLRAVEQLGEELNIRLTVISGVEGSDYTGTPPNEVDVRDVQRRLDDNPRITWHRRLAHERVMSEIELHHVGLLPTFADTFGYAALENMSLGVPSIVSNVQALPEFTGTDTGWQVEVATDNRGVWVGRHPDIEQRRTHYFETVESSTAQISKILASIRANPAVLKEKSLSALKRFETQFDPIERSESVRSVYRLAIA